MKIQYISDLHFEFGSQHLIYHINQCESDVVVIAGDLHSSKGIIESLVDINAKLNKHIVFVMGNHEYYHSTKYHVDALLASRFQYHPKVHVLNNDVWDYNGVVFLGSTGWWTMNKAKDAVKGMNDYKYIFDLMPANNGLDWGWESYNFFTVNLRKYDKRITGKTVVCVSHNAPSIKSIGDDYQDDKLNPCFVNNWEHLMQWYKPKIWIHGHTHDTKNYKIDDTLVLCNPYGYEKVYGSINNQFDTCKIIEI